jgi:hypothetical protein
LVVDNPPPLNELTVARIGTILVPHVLARLAAPQNSSINGPSRNVYTYSINPFQFASISGPQSVWLRFQSNVERATGIVAMRVDANRSCVIGEQILADPSAADSLRCSPCPAGSFGFMNAGSGGTFDCQPCSVSKVHGAGPAT